MRCSDESAAQEIEGGLGGAPADELAIAGKVEFAVLRLDVVRKGDEDGADGFFVRTSIRTGDAGDRQTEIRAGAFANSLGHRFRNRRTHRAVLE